jgi:hypothetical protein
VASTASEQAVDLAIADLWASLFYDEEEKTLVSLPDDSLSEDLLDDPI